MISCIILKLALRTTQIINVWGDSPAWLLKLCLVCRGKMVASEGRLVKREHTMSYWPELFFHIWVGVRKGGRRKIESRWEASVLIIGVYWPPALTDSMKCSWHADRCLFWNCNTLKVSKCLHCKNLQVNTANEAQNTQFFLVHRPR